MRFEQQSRDTVIPMDQVTVKPVMTAPKFVQSPASQSPPSQLSSATTAQSEPAKHGHRKAVFPVSDGDVPFLFPEDLTVDGIEKLEAYLAVSLKKEKRLAHEPAVGMPSVE